jgi:FdhD protein
MPICGYGSHFSPWIKDLRYKTLGVIMIVSSSAKSAAMSCADRRPSHDSTVSWHITSFADGVVQRDRSDCLAVEAPLEVQLASEPFTVLMRTPGHDEELVRGLLFSEGIISENSDILAIGPGAFAGDGNLGDTVNVQLAASSTNAGRTAVEDRQFYSSSSCGVCGKKTIASLSVQGQVCESNLRVSLRTLAGLPQQLQSAQSLFALTGGVHASGLFRADGELVAVREDVGRHNALDKLIGWALMQNNPLTEYLLLVSGRVSYEIAQKAIAASLPIIVAVGAPSSLAVELSNRFKITLVGFLRAGGMNIYTSPERIVE